MAWLALLIASAAALRAQAGVPFSCTAGPLRLDVTSGFSYSVSLHGSALLDDGTFALHLSGWHTAREGTLQALNATAGAGSDAALGDFVSLDIFWAAAAQPTTPWLTTFLCYGSSGLLEFRSAFPLGVPLGAGLSPSAPLPDPAFYSFNVSRAPSAHFPSFRLGPAAPASALGHAQWAGEFSFHLNNYNVSLEGYESGQLGGPTVLHTPRFAPGAKPLAAVLGTLAAHKDHIMGIVPDPASGLLPWRWAFGPHAHLRALPPSAAPARLGLIAPSNASAAAGRFEALLPGDTGITAAVYAYGAALRALHKTQRFAPEDDLGVAVLSAWCDNGSVYDGDYWAEAANQGRGGEVFTAWRAALAQAGIPVASLQLDPFWYGEGSPGNTDWQPSRQVFGAGGFDATRSAWRNMTLYSYMWGAPASALAPAFQPFAFMQSPRWNNSMRGPFTRVAAKDSRAFYALLMARCLAWGCAGFEIDFLDMNYFGWQEDMGVAGAFEAFLQGLSDAGAAAGVPVQLCMPLPADVLTSAALPGVSNIRASGDDDLLYASGSRWRIGFTSLLYGALDIRPFQDVIWTHPCYAPGANPGPYPDSYCQNATELGVAIGALSTGPLGLGDAAGYSNATLLLGAVASNGVILKPSLPATPLDLFFSYPPAGSSSSSGSGSAAQALPRSALQAVHAELWQAPSFIPHVYAWTVGAAGQGKGGLGRFLRRTTAAPPASPVPHTFPTPTACPYMSLLAVDIPAALNFSVLPGDLTPSLALPSSACNATVYISTRATLEPSAACAHGAPALPACAALFDSAGHALGLANAPIPVYPLARGGPHAFAVLALAPVLAGSGGWVFVGEVGKFVAVSPVRFSSVRLGGACLGVVVEGAGGEVVRVLLLAPGAAQGLEHATVHVEDVGPFPEGGGTLVLTCEGAGSAARCITSAA